MDHLFSSVVRILRMSVASKDGTASYGWDPIVDRIDPALPLGQLRCRLDLTFLRPGKDAPMPIEAGKAQDRVGVMFCRPTPHLKAGDRLVTVSGPVSGLFEIRNIPDQANDYAWQHHTEVQIVEVAQSLPGKWPGAQE